MKSRILPLLILPLFVSPLFSGDLPSQSELEIDLAIMDLKQDPNPAKIQRALDIAKKLPDGPDRQNLINEAKASFEKLKQATGSGSNQETFLNVAVSSQPINWKLAEVKKTELAKLHGAPSITLKDGRTVQIQSVTLLTPSGLRWIGDNIEETPWSNLPDDLREKYGWQSKYQAEYEAWKTTSGRQASAAISAEKVRLLNEQNASASKAEMEGQVAKTRVAVSLRVSQALVNGCLCYGKRIEQSAYWGQWVGLKWVPGMEEAEEHDEPIFVVGLPATVVDGDKMAGWLYPCGVYRYETVAGSTKTVRKYAITLDHAMNVLRQGGTE